MFERGFIHHKFPESINTNPSNGKKLPLKDFVTFKKGKKLAGDAIDNGLYPLFSASIETKKINEYSFDEEALLLSLSGKIFVKYYSGKFETTSEVCVLRINKDKILGLFEVINFQIHIFNCAAQGTGLKHLSIVWLKNFEVSLPPDNLLNLFNKFSEPIQTLIDSLTNQVGIFQAMKTDLIERIYSQNLKIS